MKTLHLLRHAKSAWDLPELSDRDRGLNKRGKRDAPRMGNALAKRLAPMPLHVSPARRAQLTLQGVCSAWPALAATVHHTEEALYTFSSDDLFDWLVRRESDSAALFILGHNPALTDLVNALVGHHCLDNLPTTGYVELTMAIDRWRDLSPGGAVLAYSLFPKALEK